MDYIITQSSGTVISIVTTAGIAGIVWLGTLGLRSNKIRALLSNPERQFVFYYRGSEYPDMNKRLTFNLNGSIGEGKNSNEHAWKVRFGNLLIYNNENKLYSKFKWNQESGKLVHTNDPALPSVLGQYMTPFFIKPRKDTEHG